ncbi:MAG: sensor histidine kinase [Candidatus Electrothrix sp. AX5]|nr:sensor histidine kinase [Candidatus Electrothrix sp. AX5]
METQKGKKLVTDNVTALQNENKILNDRIATLQEEKQLLADQVAHLFQSEQQRIWKGREVDEQYRFFRSFSELGKKVNADSKKEDILKATTEFILYEINFERCLIFLHEEKNDSFNLHAIDGYYDDELNQRMSSLSISRDEPALSNLYSAADTEFILCAEDCRQQDVLQLRSMFKMYEYVVFPMQYIGFLVVGNSKERKEYQARIPSESKESKSEVLLRIRNLVSQTTSALNNAVLKENLEIKNQEFKKLNKNLRAVNTVGQKLTSDISKNRSIEKLIHEQAGKVMNVDNMYICKYDEQTGILEFTLESIKGKLLEKEQLTPSRRIKLDDKTEDGLTEYVIRHKEILRIDDVPEWCGKNNITLPRQPPKESDLSAPMKLESCLCAPMILDRKLLGIIALLGFDQKAAYNEDDLEVLEIMAVYAAISFENRRLYESKTKKSQELEEQNKHLKDAQEKIAENERFRTLSQFSVTLLHKMNNLIGPVSTRIEMIKDMIAPETQHYQDIMLALDRLLESSKKLIRMAKEMRKRTKTSEKIEEVVLSDLLEQTLQDLRRLRPDIEGTIQFERAIENDVPAVHLEKERLGNLFENMINNAVDAMQPKGGTLVISGRRIEKNGRPGAEIAIADTGVGISPDDKDNNIFRLLYTTKEDGFGFGLWGDKMFLKEIGGEIAVKSEVGNGSTFTVIIPGINAGSIENKRRN